MVLHLTDRDWKRLIYAVLLAALVATAAVVFARPAEAAVYVPMDPASRAFYKWCETASNWAYIMAGCWVR